MGINGLTSSLNQFIAAFNAGYTQLAPYAMGLLATLIVLDVALTGAFTALGKHHAGSLLERVLFLGGWTWLTTSFPTLAKAFRDSLIAAGLIAGGRGAGDHTLLSDPSRIASLGLTVTEPLLALAEKSGVLDGGDMLIYWFCYCLLMLCFLLMALQVYLAVLEFYIRVSLSCILLPFGVFGPTRFIGEKGIGAIVSSGIKLMVLAFILSVGEPILATSIRLGGEDPGFNALWAAILSSGGMLFLTWMAPSIAAGYLSGTPVLSAANAAQAAVTGATLAAGGTAATVAATRLAAGAVGTLGQAGAHVAGAAAEGRKIGALADAISGGDGGPVPQIVGMARGAASAVGGALANGTRRVAASGGDGPRAAFARGAEAFRQRHASKPDPLSSPPSKEEWSAATGGYTKASLPDGLPAGKLIRIGAVHDPASLVEAPPPREPAGPSAAPSEPRSVAPAWADRARRSLVRADSDQPSSPAG